MGRAKLGLAIVTSLALGFIFGNLPDSSGRKILRFSGVWNDQVKVSFADVAESVSKSVVSVISTKIIDLNQMHEGFELWSPMRPEQDGKRKSLGFGSGFVIDEQGLIVTNEHVIDDARQITVRLFDGDEYRGTLLGMDKETDLALIKISSQKRLVAVRLGDSDVLRVGDWVMAVGNPYNYEHTVTVGVVSAKDRKIDDNPFESYIQTDAAINVGNSGGPLFNADGEVVAINSAISTKGRGIGFAIPINLAKDIVHQLEERGRVVRGFLGLRPEAITEEHVKILRLPARQGVLVSYVSPDAAAHRAGIQRYDVITEINGGRVQDKDEFFRKVAEAVPGTVMKLRGIRDQKPVDFEVMVRERHPLNQVQLVPEPAPSESQPVPEVKLGDLGIAVQELTDQHRKTFQLETGVSGVVIVNVSNISPAADAGLSAGEVIFEINKHPVKSLVEYQKLISHFKRDGAIMLLVSSPRRYETRIVTLKLDSLGLRSSSHLDFSTEN